MNKKIVFFGTPEFAVPSLRALFGAGYAITAVTNPDRPTGRSLEFEAPPVKRAAGELGIPVLQPESLKDEALIAKLNDLNPLIFVVVAYGKILQPSILSIPEKGSINVHPSLLPKYRGPSPVHAAILAGERETGVTIMLLDEEMDHGPILASVKTPILENEAEPELSKRLADEGAGLLIQTIEKWLQGTVTFRPQNHEDATYSKLLKKEDGELDWNQSATTLARQVRAYRRWPGSYARWESAKNSVRLKIEEAVAVSGKSLPVGTVSDDVAGFSIQADGGALLVKRLTPDGKRSMTALEFLRGHPEIIGKRLTH